MSRPTSDEYFMAAAELVASRSTCLRRSVGCVLTNKRKHILSTGYNGVACGRPHCNEHDPFHETGYPNACAGANAASGTKLEACEAIHAEQNALLQCRDVYDVDTCYVTVSPCIHCIKLLMNTGCTRVVTWQVYDVTARNRWEDAGNEFALVPWKNVLRLGGVDKEYLPTILNENDKGDLHG